MKKKTLAFIFDVDGTLLRGNMQRALFVDFGIEEDYFWRTKDNMVFSEHEQGRLASHIAMYLGYLLQISEQHLGRKLTREDLYAYGKKLDAQYFPGIPDAFQRWKAYVANYNDQGSLHIAIITSGISDLIRGSSLAEYVDSLYGSEYYANEQGALLWAQNVVDDTKKTLYIYGLNKGNLASVNHRVPKDERKIPFSLMTVFGDGITDVPMFAVLEDKGGVDIAVYDPEYPKTREKAERLYKEHRVHEIFPADYREGKALDQWVTERLEQLLKE